MMESDPMKESGDPKMLEDNPTKESIARGKWMEHTGKVSPGMK
jgi:hypothetical protein